MIEYYKIGKGKSFEKTENYSKNSWVHVYNPDEEEIKFLVEKFDLEKESIEDGLDIYENPRFDIEENKVYLYLNVPTDKIPGEYVSSFLVIYSKDLFITLSKHNLEIFQQILKSKKAKIFSSTRNLLRIMHLVSRYFEKVVYKIQKETRLNKRDLNRLTNDDITKLIINEDKLNNYLAAFSGLITVYHRILRDKSVKTVKEDEEIVEDLIVDLNEVHSLATRSIKSISNMRNYYSTKLSNDLNKTVTILTVFTIFLSVPTLIASIYGMNIMLPFQHSKWIFPELVILTTAVLLLIFVIIKKKGIVRG